MHAARPVLEFRSVQVYASLPIGKRQKLLNNFSTAYWLISKYVITHGQKFISFTAYYSAVGSSTAASWTKLLDSLINMFSLVTIFSYLHSWIRVSPHSCIVNH
jgi:hypothetical protein